MSIRSVKGMNDVLPPQIHVWRWAESIIRSHFEDFGFSEVKTPVVEYTELFARGVGETTDVVEKEMYTFLDRNEESLSLRPEGTAPVVRAYLEAKFPGQDPQQKLYYIGPMFRYERPQKGRYRQFFQYGLEIFGIEAASVDAELIYLLVKLYEKFGLQNLEVKINSVGNTASRAKFRDALLAKLTPRKAELCSDCQRRLEKNPLRVLDCKNPNCQKIAQDLPSIIDFLDDESKKHFEELKAALDALKVKYVIDPRLVRGLDYYNLTAFEITSSGLGSQNAVGGGGRYDSLVQDFGGPKTPAVGYAGGFERLVLLLEEMGKTFDRQVDVFLAAADEKGAEKALVYANQLRSLGVKAELDHGSRKLKNQLARAEKLKAKKTWVLGGSEIEKGVIILKDMQSRSQAELSLSLSQFEKLLEQKNIGELRKAFGLGAGSVTF